MEWLWVIWYSDFIFARLVGPITVHREKNDKDGTALERALQL